MKIQTKKQTVIARNVPPMRFIIAMFLSALLLAACGDDSENAGGTVEETARSSLSSTRRFRVCRRKARS